MRALAAEDDLLVELAAVVVVVVALAAVEVVDGAAVEVGVDGADTAVVVAVVDAVDWRAMPSPSALATPMLREATRARLRAAGCGRFLVMGRTYGPAVSGWSAHGERQV